jgi:MFS family permease
MSKVGAAIKEAASDFARGTRAFPGSVRRAVRDPKSVTGGAPVVPIAVLFGHTFLDAFDRYGFNVILPEVQDHFDLELKEITALASVSIVAGILLSVPVSLWSDRGGRRILFLGGGALVAAFFSVTAGLATTVALFGLSRAGFGFGLIVNDPVQQSLLADFTPVRARPSVFAGRQMMDNVGGLLGPLVFGLLAFAVSWRAPLIGAGVLAIGLGVLSLRLREPAKGCMERAEMGVTGADLDVEDEPAGVRESWRILSKIPTVRTLWFSLPFLFGGVLGMLVLIPLFLDEVYGMSAAERGTASALIGIPGIFGLFVGIALSKRYLFSEAPWRMFQLIGGIAVLICVCVVWMAAMPLLALSLVGVTVLVMLFSLILPAFGTLFSIVMPPQARTVGFALTRLWALPGLFVLPIGGAIGDEYGLRWGVLVSLPIFVIGAVIIARGGRSFQADMAAAHDASMVALTAKRAERAAARAADDTPDPALAD